MAEKGRKRKSVGRASSSRPQPPVYNSEMFRSLGCEKFHESINENAKFVKEKALRLAPGEFEEIRQAISDRGWENFVNYPKMASKALVFEFFSNVFPKQAIDGELVFPCVSSYVRGCEVPFDAGVINRLFGMPNVEVLECLKRTISTRKQVKLNPNRAEEICEALCKPGMDWVRNAAGEPQKILASSLTPVARGWAAFILATVCPSSNQSELNIDRAILASCIMRGEPVNLGFVLADEIRMFAKFKDGALPSYWRHASLISLLCERAGVVANEGEETISPASAITGSWIRSRVGLEQPMPREEPPQEPPQEQPDEDEPTFSMEDFSMGPTSEDFKELQGRMDVFVLNQNEMRQNLHDMRQRQEEMAAEHRFGMRALYRAICTSQRGGQLDPEADIFQAPPQ